MVRAILPSAISSFYQCAIITTTANAVASYKYRQDELRDVDVGDSLHQKGRFAAPWDSSLTNEEGSVRQRTCEPLGFCPLEPGQRSFLDY